MYLIVKLGLLLGIVCLSACSRDTVGTFEIINKSGQKISQISIEICGQNFERTNMAPNANFLFEFKLNCEGHYLIAAELNSGVVVKENIGYVTRRIDSAQKFNINANSITLSYEDQPSN